MSWTTPIFSKPTTLHYDFLWISPSWCCIHIGWRRKKTGAKLHYVLKYRFDYTISSQLNSCVSCRSFNIGFHQGKLEENCTLVRALRLCTCRTAYRGSRSIALLFLDHGTRRGWGASVTPRPLFTPWKTRYPLAGWVPGPVWTGAENLASTEILSPDRPARSQSLYRLNYPAHVFHQNL